MGCQDSTGAWVNYFLGTALRFEHSIKPLHKFKSQGKRSKLIYTIKERGEYEGAYFFREYSEEAEAILNYLCPQVGFLRKSGGYEWHLIDNLPEKTSVDLSEYDQSSPYALKIIECDPEEAINALRQKGFDIKQGEEFSLEDDFDTEITGEVTRNIDDNIFRPIAKMGFNYLAKWKGRDFVLDSIFDPIRRYIRWGELPDFPIKFALSGSFLPIGEEENDKKGGHIIAIYWEETERSLVACVSLCNFISYFVRLAKDEAGRYKELRKGSYFDFYKHQILEIDMTRIDLSFSYLLSFEDSK